eukprot:1159406-Pelagomonas_calceolata.AAC.4
MCIIESCKLGRLTLHRLTWFSHRLTTLTLQRLTSLSLRPTLHRLTLLLLRLTPHRLTSLSLRLYTLTLHRLTSLPRTLHGCCMLRNTYAHNAEPGQGLTNILNKREHPATLPGRPRHSSSKKKH